jgi:hypothetical protein
LKDVGPLQKLGDPLQELGEGFVEAASGAGGINGFFADDCAALTLANCLDGLNGSLEAILGVRPRAQATAQAKAATSRAAAGGMGRRPSAGRDHADHAAHAAHAADNAADAPL